MQRASGSVSYHLLKQELTTSNRRLRKQADRVNLYMSNECYMGSEQAEFSTNREQTGCQREGFSWQVEVKTQDASRWEG